MKFWALGLAAVLIVAGGVAWLQPLQADAPVVGLLPYTDDQAIALGATVYAENCAACHGAGLEGETENWRAPGPDGRLPAPPHDETGHTWHHADALLVAITKYGSAAVVGGGYQSNMPAFEGVLDDGQILAVLAYIKSTWPPEVIAIHDDINRQAALSR